MEKWKEKICKEIHKQWMSKEKVSLNDIISWVNNPQNNADIYSGVMECYLKSLHFTLMGLFYPILKHIYKYDEENLNIFSGNWEK